MAFNQKQFDSIIKHIEEGNSLRSALKQPGTPSSKTFYEWIDDDDELRKRYARASEKRADAIFEDIIDIADDTSKDVDEIDIGDGVIATKVNHENIQRSKLRVDARKWMLAKMNPKKYSDKNQVDVTTNGESINMISLGTGKDPNETAT